MDPPPIIPDTPTSAERLRHAHMMGTVSGLKGLVDRDRERAATERERWPELWERIDRLNELIDWR